MGREDIVNTILSDAEKEAQEIIAQAEAKAAAVRQTASDEAKRLLDETQTETALRAKAIADGKAATARLDCAKILLAEKRGVLSSVYAHAYDRLLALGEKECVALFERLLKEYAEEGDEVAISPKFRYRAALEKLSVLSAKKLTVVTDKTVEGGMILHGKTADVDLTYGALLARDREEHQSEIAFEIFK